MIIIPDHIEDLIFDLDGTLADTMPLHLSSWVEVGKKFNVDITEDLILQHSGTPTLKIVEIFNKEFGWNLDKAEVRKAKHQYFSQFKKEQGKIKPIAEIYELAKNMKGKMPMSVGTGSSRPNAIASLEDMEMTDWWVTVITGSDDVAGKPSPDIFLACAEAMNVAPDKCLVFEDGAAGIKAAQAANMMFIDVTKL